MKFDDNFVQDDLKSIVSQPASWEKLKNSTVLVTGVTGMLATYIGYTLHYLNVSKHLNIHAVLTYRNQNKLEDKFEGLLQCSDLEFVQHDVVQPMAISGPIDWIIHAAGNASPKYILSDPVGIINANTVGTEQLLKLAVEKKVQGFHFLSTREVYGKVFPGTTQIDEDSYGALDTLESRSCYPESKRMAETLIKSYSDQYGVPYTLSRIAHSYGPGMNISDDGRVMSDFISNAVNFQNIVLKSDGSALRAFCYVADAVGAIFLAMLNGHDGLAYNIANEDEQVSIKSLAELIISIVPERKLKLSTQIPQNRNGGYASFKRISLNTSRMEQLGWRKYISLEYGIKKTIFSFQKEQR